MIIQTEAITKTPEALLAQLDRPEWYAPALAKMSPRRQSEWLTIRVLLKNTLGEEKLILYTDSGKPYLADSSYFVSISHTKGYAAVALDEKHPVAIDIEHISPRVERIRSRFMNETEEKNLSNRHPLIHLLLHWSAKETLFKYLNENDIEFQSQLHIHPFEPVVGEWGEFTAHETRTEKRQNFNIRYIVKEAYVLTAVLCSPQENESGE
ncbi:MAG: 4'-phosphopantetheinyl transferase superfamily protein [Dysgonamonadaceae bacterium]|jgi:4'-phosphopantetheinyl transferase EntD|nr:4'-phosphopantetheinyl transferase superfamily protein [Dysgonamonadaceae bacterium]